jgi:hypothetical protein
MSKHSALPAVIHESRKFRTLLPPMIIKGSADQHLGKKSANSYSKNTLPGRNIQWAFIPDTGFHTNG